MALAPPSGHVFRVDRRRGPVWFAKYRLPDGRQVQKKIGPAWTGRGRPPAGFVTKRQAEAWLIDVLANDCSRLTRGSSYALCFAGRSLRFQRFLFHEILTLVVADATYR